MSSNPLSGYYYVTPTELDGISTAIQLKTGVSDDLTYPNSYISALAGTGGITQEALDYIAGDISVLSVSGLTSIKSYAFNYHSTLEIVNLPDVTNIGSTTFQGCTNLSQVIIPNCSAVNAYLFASCTSLLSVSFPNCYSIGENAFNGCTNLSTIYFPAVSYIGYGAFQNCSNLLEANFSALNSYISDYAFYMCRALSNVSLPMCTGLRQYVFAYCYSLASINLPSASYISYGAFLGCSALSIVKLPYCASIYGTAFQYCRKLLSLYLEGSSICTLSNTNAFSSTPIGGYTGLTGGVYGSIFVPATLYDKYISATNWAVYSDRFVSV